MNTISDLAYDQSNLNDIHTNFWSYCIYAPAVLQRKADWQIKAMPGIFFNNTYFVCLQYLAGLWLRAQIN